MLTGKPVIASDIPVHRETLRDGETGILLPLDDPAAWSEAIVALLEDAPRARRLGANARRDAVERFDVRRIAQLHERLYREVVARSDSHGETAGSDG
jgi:phosphatidylinositol alpha-mannosyltransferase